MDLQFLLSCDFTNLDLNPSVQQGTLPELFNWNLAWELLPPFHMPWAPLVGHVTKDMVLKL